MSIVSATTAKSYFETGDRPSQSQFGDLIDSTMRPTLMAIASGAEGGNTGLLEITGTAAIAYRSTGTVGNQMLSASGTASAQGHIGAGTVGRQLLESAATASATNALGLTIGTVGLQVLGAGGTASAQGHIGAGTVGRALIEAVTTASVTNITGTGGGSGGAIVSVTAAAFTGALSSAGTAFFSTGIVMTVALSTANNRFHGRAAVNFTRVVTGDPSGSEAAFTVDRNGTNIATLHGDNSALAVYNISASTLSNVANVEFIDTPGAGNMTYTVQVRRGAAGGTVRINQNESSAKTGPSWLTIQELLP